MDRGIKDEAFVRRALHEADFDMGRWIANQSGFNHADSRLIDPVTKAAVVTAVAIYGQKYDLPDDLLQSAVSITTCGEARKLIDQIFQIIPPMTEDPE